MPLSLLSRLLARRAGNAELPHELPEDIGVYEEEEEEYLLAPEIAPSAPATTQSTPAGQPAPAPRQVVLHLTDADFQRAAQTLNVSVPTIRAVAHVEAAGRGFHNGSGVARPIILYEAHVFSRLTNHQHLNARDSRGNALASRTWNRALYGPAGEWQHDGRLTPAARLHRDAALQACSWGFFQIMGENARSLGQTIQAFVNGMYSGAGYHLDMFVRFIQVNRLDGHLRNRNWAAFARAYNGPGFATHRPPYDQRLADAFRRFS